MKMDQEERRRITQTFCVWENSGLMLVSKE